jgi:hypothetical protein
MKTATHKFLPWDMHSPQLVIPAKAGILFIHISVPTDSGFRRNDGVGAE